MAFSKSFYYFSYNFIGQSMRQEAEKTNATKVCPGVLNLNMMMKSILGSICRGEIFIVNKFYRIRNFFFTCIFRYDFKTISYFKWRHQ